MAADKPNRTMTLDPRERQVLDQKIGELGPFVLLDVIGEGGMGAVYLAEQTMPVKRLVAIKVTRVDLGSVGRIARFESECQILATLRHPNIAQIHDAGETTEGYPFLVMEFIDGLTLDTHIQRFAPTLEARLALFLQACEAVAFAHQNGVIHRDIKPSNLIVEQTDSVTRVKLIDFGIAKLVQDDASALKQTDLPIGTPDYMSPEQLANEVELDTRTDVYSLGRTLWQLVVGQLPGARIGHTVSVAHKSADRRTWIPSRVVQSMDLAQFRMWWPNDRPASIAAQVKGDLDWILLKATHFDREQRYASVRELAADIRRHLQRQPILAAPPSVLYLLRKFLSRHRLMTALAGVMSTLLLVSGIGLYTAWKAEREARDLSDRQLRMHRSFNDFLLHVILTAKPTQPGTALRVSEVLDYAATELPTHFKDNPEAGLAMRLLLMRIAKETGSKAPTFPATGTSAESDDRKLQTAPSAVSEEPRL